MSSLGNMQPVLTGKVRDLFAVGDDQLLFVASDRISAFDHVLGSVIPDKGKVLTQISLFWFERLRGLVPNHLVTADTATYPAELAPYADELRGPQHAGPSCAHGERGVRGARLPVRLWVEGLSADWRGVRHRALPPKLAPRATGCPEPIFTPPPQRTHTGHDENIGFDAVVESVGAETAETLRHLTLSLYAAASAYAETKGLILADTKFEFGYVDGKLVLADEVLTPDSSRYWLASGYAPGGAQPSFDKQFVRDYLERIAWNKQPPAPALPDEVVDETRAKYLEAFRLLTGLKELPE